MEFSSRYINMFIMYAYMRVFIWFCCFPNVQNTSYIIDNESENDMEHLVLRMVTQLNTSYPFDILKIYIGQLCIWNKKYEAITHIYIRYNDSDKVNHSGKDVEEHNVYV